MTERGKFIALEGGEGAGKTTLLPRLARALEEMGYEVVLTREPGGTATGEKLREMIFNKEINCNPRVALCLFLADRVLHLLTVVRPALGEGKIILSDRSEGSTIAYQAYLGGLPREQVEQFNHLITGGLTPDLTILLDLSPEVGLARKQKPGLEVTHYDAQPLEWHRRLRQAFLILARTRPNWVIVDAEKSPEEIQESVLDILRRRGIV